MESSSLLSTPRGLDTTIEGMPTRCLSAGEGLPSWQLGPGFIN